MRCAAAAVCAIFLCFFLGRRGGRENAVRWQSSRSWPLVADTGLAGGFQSGLLPTQPRSLLTQPRSLLTQPPHPPPDTCRPCCSSCGHRHGSHSRRSGRAGHVTMGLVHRPTGKSNQTRVDHSQCDCGVDLILFVHVTYRVFWT